MEIGVPGEIKTEEHHVALTPAHVNTLTEAGNRVSIQEGMKYLETQYGGKGVLLSGVENTPPGNVLVVGGGVVGRNAAEMAQAIGANVTILDVDEKVLKSLRNAFPHASVRHCDEETLDELLPDADVVVGAVLVPGQETPVVIRSSQVELFDPGTVLVDVSIDEGGCVESSRPTSHKEPIFTVNEVIHYCVPNIPGVVPKTATRALCNRTFPYIQNLADNGEEAFEKCRALQSGLALRGGEIQRESLHMIFN